jgi:hypothetical protein
VPYHLTDRAKAHRGEIVRPGNWGFLVSTWYSVYGKPHPFYRREMIFESVRRNEFSHLPSRLRSAFAHDDLLLARQWLQPGERLFEVRLLGFRHRADIGWTSRPANGGDFSGGRLVVDNARHYWRGEPHPHDAPGNYYEWLAAGGLILGNEMSAEP